jgi:hypothetical protein
MVRGADRKVMLKKLKSQEGEGEGHVIEGEEEWRGKKRGQRAEKV